MSDGCCGGLECDCVPDRVEVLDAKGTVIGINARASRRKPYVGMGVHYVDIEARGTACRAAFVVMIRSEGLLLAVLMPSGVVIDGDVTYSDDGIAGTWHHIHEEEF